MKVIFLDFDGVILTLRTCVAGAKGWTNSPPDYTLMLALKRMGDAGVRIVISSTHREFGKPHCRKILNFFPRLHVWPFVLEDWKTKDGGNRPAEITEWLSRHPEVTDWRIVDDDAFPWTEEQDQKWIRCPSLEGISSEELIKLCEWARITRKQMLAGKTFTGAEVAEKLQCVSPV